MAFHPDPNLLLYTHFLFCSQSTVQGLGLQYSEENALKRDIVLSANTIHFPLQSHSAAM
jgi:hypothetical protein